MAQSGDGLTLAKRPARFRAPDVAVPIRTPAAWVVMVAVAIAAGACAAALEAGARWPSPEPAFTLVALAVLVAVANAFGAHQTVNGLSAYTSLGLPVAFASLLVLDWRSFVLAVALGEALTFVSEFSRRTNPTMWYVRIYNVCTIVLAGAVATSLLGDLGAFAAPGAGSAWLAPGPALGLLFAAVAFQAVDGFASAAVVALAANEPLASLRPSPRTFAARLALFLLAVPFAHAWSRNVWEALFSLVPLALAYRILSVPELEHRLRVDARTGLANAGAFDLELGATVETARRQSSEAAVLAIDIDHFKSINDSYGHPVGDAVIERFATILLEVARRNDLTARVGGEEFALLVRDAGRDEALALAERVRARIQAERFVVDGGPAQPIAITASVGVAVFPHDGATPRELYAAADAALYRAKEGGRNAVRGAGERRTGPSGAT